MFSAGLNCIFGIFSGTKESLVIDATFHEAEEPEVEVEVEVASGVVPPPLEIELSLVDAALLLMT